MTAPAPTPRRARVGVSLMFFTNGVLYSALLPRYPEIKQQFDLGDAAFGLVVVSFATGAILAAGAAAPFIRRCGARRVVGVGSLLMAAAMWGAGASPGVGLFVAMLALAGLVDAVVDAAQNVQGVAVERWYGRSIINSLHAVWSLGATTGGLIGALAVRTGVGLGEQMAVNGVVWAAVALLSARLAAAPGEDDGGAAGPEETVGRARALRLLLPLVVLAICGTLVEDIANNWVVLYLGSEAGAPAEVAALGLSVVLAAQFVGRLLGDPMTDRWGREAIARAGGLLIAAGILTALLSPSYPLAFVGFAVAGFGTATLVPAAFAAADRVPGLPRGSGVALLGWLMRLGFLLTSPAVGAISEASTLRVALVLPLLAGLVAATMATLARRRG